MLAKFETVFLLWYDGDLGARLEGVYRRFEDAKKDEGNLGPKHYVEEWTIDESSVTDD